MTAETLTESQRVITPELPEVGLARVFMGTRGSVRWEVPDCLDLSAHPELFSCIDKEFSNGRVWIIFQDAQLAGEYLHLQSLAAKESIRRVQRDFREKYLKDGQ